MAVAIALSLAATAGAYQPYQYGFESTSPPAPLDWTPYIGNPAPTQSGGGVLGLTAPQGNYYYESVNQHDAAFGGYGASGYSSFGIPNTDGDPNYTAGYAQSIQIYIDPTNWAPGQGFAVDGSPGLAGAFVPTLGNVATNYQGYEYNDETQIQISVPHAGLVSVDASPGGHIANITSPGWYTFVTEFKKCRRSDGPGREQFRRSRSERAHHRVGAGRRSDRQSACRRALPCSIPEPNAGRRELYLARRLAKRLCERRHRHR